MALWVRTLDLTKHEDLSADLSTHVKSQVWPLMCLYPPCCGLRLRQEDLWGLLVLSLALGSMRDCLKEIRRNLIEQHTQCLLWLPCLHRWAHLHTHAYTAHTCTTCPLKAQILRFISPCPLSIQLFNILCDKIGL